MTAAGVLYLYRGVVGGVESVPGSLPPAAGVLYLYRGVVGGVESVPGSLPPAADHGHDAWMMLEQVGQC